MLAIAVQGLQQQLVGIARGTLAADCSFMRWAALPSQVQRHPEHDQKQRNRDNRTRPGYLVIDRPPINQSREVIYLIGVIQRVRAGALDIVKEPVGNFGDAEIQCGCGERQDNNRDRQPSRQSLLMKDVAFFRDECGGGDDDAVKR